MSDDDAGNHSDASKSHHSSTDDRSDDEEEEDSEVDKVEDEKEVDEVEDDKEDEEEDDAEDLILGTEVTTASEYILRPYTHAQILDALYSVYELHTAAHSFYNRVAMNKRRDAPQHVQFVLRVFETDSHGPYGTFCDMRRFEQNVLKTVKDRPTPGTNFYEVKESNWKFKPTLCRTEYLLASAKVFEDTPGHYVSAVESKYSPSDGRTTHLTMAHWVSFAAHTQNFSDSQLFFALPLTDSFEDEDGDVQFINQFTDSMKKSDQHKSLTERQRYVITRPSIQRVLVFNHFKCMNEHLAFANQKHHTTVHNPVIRRMLMKIHDVLGMRI